MEGIVLLCFLVWLVVVVLFGFLKEKRKKSWTSKDNKATVMVLLGTHCWVASFVWQVLWLMRHSDPWITTMVSMFGLICISRVLLTPDPLTLPVILQALVFLYKIHFWLYISSGFIFLHRTLNEKQMFFFIGKLGFFNQKKRKKKKRNGYGARKTVQVTNKIFLLL